MLPSRNLCASCAFLRLTKSTLWCLCDRRGFTGTEAYATNSEILRLRLASYTIRGDSRAFAVRKFQFGVSAPETGALQLFAHPDEEDGDVGGGDT